MLTDRMRLAFSIENVYAGFAKVTGILRVVNDVLSLEFETKENLLGGILKSKPKKVDIPLLEPRISYPEKKMVQYQSDCQGSPLGHP